MVNLEKKKFNNPENWKITQRYTRIIHNKAVINWFKTTNTTSRLILRNSILIYKKDSANQILVKIQLFKDYIESTNKYVIAYPESYQLRAEVGRPQLAIIFSPTEKQYRNQQYVTHLPHYNGNRIPNIKSYYKGNFWAKVVLKDNSHIVVNGRTKTEAVNVVKHFLRSVNPKYSINSNFIKTGEYLGKPFKVMKMKPRRADFYSKGKLQPSPDWQYYFE